MTDVYVRLCRDDAERWRDFTIRYACELDDYWLPWIVALDAALARDPAPEADEDDGPDWLFTPHVPPIPNGATRFVWRHDAPAEGPERAATGETNK